MSVARKLTISSFDTAVVARELRNALVNMRLNSITNVSKTLYIFKLHASVSALERLHLSDPTAITRLSKQTVLLEPGFRAHTTVFDWHKAVPPTQFTMRLRSELTNLICLDVSQLCFDRVIVLSFGRYGISERKHLIIELFGKGNLILTDDSFTVLASQTRFEGACPGDSYLDYKTKSTTLLSFADVSRSCTVENFRHILEEASKSKGQAALARTALAKHFFIGGAASAVAMRAAGLSNNAKAKALCADSSLFESLWKTAGSILRAMISAVETVDRTHSFAKGYVYFYPESEIAFDTAVDDDATIKRAVRVAEYHPVRLDELLGDTGIYSPENVETYDSFLISLDTYYSLLSTAKTYQSRVSLVNKVKSKTESMHTENDNRIRALESAATRYRLLGNIVQLKAPLVERLIAILQSRFSTGGLTWSGIAVWLESSDPLVALLESVDCVAKVFTLRIPLTVDDAEALGSGELSELANILSDKVDDMLDRNLEELSDSSTRNTDALVAASDVQADNAVQAVACIDVSLDKTAGTIAEGLFDLARASEAKSARTAQHNVHVLQKATVTAQRDMKQVLESTESGLIALQKYRAPLWFEKYNWFISTDGYLVVSGRDAQSNELLVKRVMTQNDIFVHSEIHGAACTIIKCPKLPSPKTSDAVTRWVPPEQTTSEAGAMTVTHSKAWDQKVTVQAYWVYSDQVSKTAPSGQFLATGSFVIRGKRNFISPQPLALGLTVLWRYDTAATRPVEKWCEAYSGSEKALAQMTVSELPREGKGAKDSLDTGDSSAPPDGGQYMIADSKRHKDKVVTKESANRDAYKAEKKEKQKARQLIIKEQKLRAKIKRLQAEGRHEEADAATNHLCGEDPEEVASLPIEQPRFCTICGAIGHCALGCSLNNDHVRIIDTHLPPAILAAAGFSAAMQDAQQDDAGDTTSQESSRDDYQDSKTANPAERPADASVDSSVQALLLLSQRRPEGEDNPSIVMMIGPYSAIEKYSLKYKIMPGDVTRGKSHRMVQALLLDGKGVELSKYEKECVKQVPEHSVMLHIPGNFVLVGHGMGRINASNSKGSKGNRTDNGRK